MNEKTKMKGVTIQKLHGMLSHIGEDENRRTAAYLGYKINRGTFKHCLCCRKAKEKKEPIPKISDRKKSMKPNKLVFLTYQQ